MTKLVKSMKVEHRSGRINYQIKVWARNEHTGKYEALWSAVRSEPFEMVVEGEAIDDCHLAKYDKS